MKCWLADVDARVRRHQDAIVAGVDPAALLEATNGAHAARAAARAELDNVPTANELDEAEIHAKIDPLDDVG